MNCKRCATKMVTGTVICHDYSQSPRGQCVYPNIENAVWVNCSKCPECGYSTVSKDKRIL